MNQSVSDEPVYRTAPATPGLLISLTLREIPRDFLTVQATFHGVSRLEIQYNKMCTNKDMQTIKKIAPKIGQQ